MTSGGKWPDGTLYEEAGSAIIITSEDDAADTIKPRLMAAGANVAKVAILDSVEDGAGNCRSWTYDDVDVLASLVNAQQDTRIIIIDPATAYLGRRDGHNAADIRSALLSLQALSEEHGICVLLIMHLNKSQGIGAGERFNGSTAWVAVSRSAYIIGDHPQDPERRVMVPVKNNLGRDIGGYQYHIEASTIAGGIKTSKVVWDGDVDITADDVVNPKPASPRKQPPQLAEAMRFLVDQLKSGRKESKKVYSEAEQAGIAESTLKRAKRDLDVQSVKDGCWYMLLGEAKIDDCDVRSSDTPPLNPGPVGHLDTLNKKEAQEDQEVHNQSNYQAAQEDQEVKTDIAAQDVQQDQEVHGSEGVLFEPLDGEVQI